MAQSNDEVDAHTIRSPRAVLKEINRLESTANRENPKVPRSLLVSNVVFRYDTDEDTVERAIKQLRRRGEIYEPAEDKFRSV